ncbi:unnamed protein product, partial [Staurois parvus]
TTGIGPPGGAAGIGPPGGAAGARPPRWSDRSRALRRSGRAPDPQAKRRAPSHQAHDSGLRVNGHDRWHWVRHWIVWLDSGASGHQASGYFGSTAGTASSARAVGSESTGMIAGTGSDIGSSDGQRASVTRHQVIWLDSGHRVIWQGSGLRVNRHDSGHRVIRHWIVWLDSG